MDRATSTLVRTKLAVPLPHPHVLPRERLLARGLETGVHLVLVEAPAGFGKTTLLAAWCDTLRTQGDTAVAWLTLEASENDPVRFLTYLAAAVESLGCSVARAVPLGGGRTEQTLIALLNDIADLQRPCVIVLDDYHVITAPAVHTTVAFLLDHLPPHVCLVISSRAEPPLPLARLRARSELVELRAADLRFSAVETRVFLELTLEHTFSDAALQAIDQYTLGWPAGLQLFALALRGCSAIDAEGPLEGVRAQLAVGERFVFAYLADEVFQQQSAAIQRFLLHTAVLERLSGRLCAAVLADAVVDAAAIRAATEQLAALAQANIFLEPLDPEGDWFRFHPLFRSFLQDRLAREPGLCVQTLHRRAAAWYRTDGQLDDALSHMLAAGDTHEAAALIDVLAAPLVARGEYATLHIWLDRIPATELAEHPELCLWAAWSALLSGAVERVAPLLAPAETRWTATNDAAHLGEVAHLRAHLARLRCEPTKTICWAQQALAQLPPERETLRAGSILALGVGHLLASNLHDAQQTLTTALAACEQHNALGALVAHIGLGDLAAERGDVDAAQHCYETAIAAVGERPLWERWRATVRLGELARERNELGAAATLLEVALERAERDGVAVYLADGYRSLARTRWAQGDGEAATQALAHGLWLAQRLGAAAMVRQLEAQAAWFALARHDDRAVLAWLRAVAPRRASGAAGLSAEETFTLARVLLVPGHHYAPHDVQALLTPLQRQCAAQGRMSNCAVAALLCALADMRAGHLAHAVTAMRRALTCALQSYAVRTFVDEGPPAAALITAVIAQCAPNDPLRAYGEVLLAAFGDQNKHGQPGEGVVSEQDPLSWSGEMLSERELEVLRLVAVGASNKAIAESIVVSVGTVKSHLNHILGKLAAHNRTEAVARARVLGLLA